MTEIKPEDLNVEDLNLEDILIKPKATYILKSKNIQKEIFMSYDLLMKLQEYATEEPVKWELSMMDSAAQLEILKMVTMEEDEKTGTITPMPNFKNFWKYLELSDILDCFSWMQDHVSDFFTIRLFNLEKRKSRPQMKNQQVLMTHLSKNFSQLIKSVGGKNQSNPDL